MHPGRRRFAALLVSAVPACMFAAFEPTIRPVRGADADGIRTIDVDAGQQAGPAAVLVADTALVHTTQLTPSKAVVDGAGGLAAQVEDVVGQLRRLLAGFDSGLERVVRLHVCVPVDAAAAKTLERILAAFPAGRRPACTCVCGALPEQGSLVAIDAVAVSGRAAVDRVMGDATGRILPAGSRIYVSGQAADGSTAVEGTRATLAELDETLRFLGRTRADVVQYKAFISPMTDAAAVRREVGRFLEGGPQVPLVLVEWGPSPGKPVEIELVAWGGPAAGAATVEYLTPPGMKASPIFSRVARTSAAHTLYIGGLRAGSAAAVDPRSKPGAEAEVTDVFAGLDRVLRAGGSDLRHLVKATYYVSTEPSSAALNALRPKYYDPARAPAASKAPVVGVGRQDRGLLLDMIAVPAGDR